MSSNRDSLSMQIVTPCSRVVAVLGPTNTGKTHYAMERMLGHASGMIGFPLRLLARENYDRAKRLKGASAVALITGEEKIVPFSEAGPDIGILVLSLPLTESERAPCLSSAATRTQEEQEENICRYRAELYPQRIKSRTAIQRQ